MKHYKFQLNGQAISLSFDDNSTSLQDFLIDGKAPQVSDEQLPAFVAAIVLALFEHDIEVVHDDEPDVITLKPSRAGWVSPAELMNEKSNISKNLHAPEIPSGEGNLM